MEAPVIRDEVLAFAQSCQAFAEFSRYNNELTIAEREVIGHSLAATLSNLPPID